MKHNYYTLLGLAFTALPAVAGAQTQPKDTTVNRTVVVEQQYIPDIMDASKVNVLPKVEEPSVSKKEVEYATFTSPAKAIPAGTMQAYTGKETRREATPGYVRLGYGNYNNLDVFGNYLFRLSEKDRLNLNFRMDGMKGTLDMPFRDKREWNAYYYRTRAQVNYLHQFAKLDLNVAGNFGLSNFNYEPYGFDFKKQKFTSGDVHVGVRSTDEMLPVQFRAETNLMLYNRQHCQFFGGVNETQIRTLGSVSGKINDEQQVLIGLRMDNLIYGTDSKSYKTAIEEIFDSRTTLNLNPAYELNNDAWRLHVGANVDFSFGSGKTLRVSPDVTAQYVFSDSYVLYAKATGGRQLTDLRRLETYNPYLNPSNRVTDTYEQVNAALGFKASPTPGLWFDIFGGYQNLKDDLYQMENGWVGGSGGNFIDLGQTDTDNFYAGAKISYAYKDLFSVSTGGTYYHWTADGAIADYTSSPDYNVALLMKPQFKFGFNAEVHPLPTLWVNLGYEYIYRAERLYYFDKSTIPSVNDLSLGATYNVYKGLSVYIKADNLLNKQYQYYLAYPVEGINFVGGLSFRF